MKTVVIVGPTASGKTDLSILIAEDIFEIISADSVQVYRQMDIGSSKPSVEVLKTVRHHMIDIVDPDYHFTAGDFCLRAAGIMDELESRGRVPLVVGGTGFYIDSFFNGIDEIPDIDSDIRDTTAVDYDEDGGGRLYLELQRIDPEFAARVHKNDRQRVVRAISVYRGTGQPISSFFKVREKESKYKPLFIGINIEKSILHRRIDARTDLMIENGFVDEVKMLRSKGYSPELNSMQSIGYLEINGLIDGRFSLKEAVEKIKKNTKQYAKKQLTWFKKNKNVNWFGPDEIKRIPEIVKKWLNLD